MRRPVGQIRSGTKISRAMAAERAVETSEISKQDPENTNAVSKEPAASVSVPLEQVSTERTLDEEPGETEERVSKLECLTCGILRRERGRGRKTPRLEFAEDTLQQQQQEAERGNSGVGEPVENGGGAEAANNASSSQRESTENGDAAHKEQTATDARYVYMSFVGKVHIRLIYIL